MKSFHLLTSLPLLLSTIVPSDTAVVFQTTPSAPTTLEDFKHRHHDYRANIVGGKPVNPPFKYGEWLVALMKDDFQFCAGSMFGPNLVVTAAHCSVLGFPLDSLRVLAHRYNLDKPSSEEDGVEMKVEKIVVHPDFSFYSLDNDIAVWYVKGGENLKTTVRLDNGKNSWVGRQCNVIGWGAIDEAGPPSDVLQEVQVPVIAAETCKKILGSRITDSMICAGGVHGEDACQGDSGGPMVVMRNFERPVLVGVVSWGQGCARDGFPGVYTRVSKHRTWLRGFLPDGSDQELDEEDVDDDDLL